MRTLAPWQGKTLVDLGCGTGYWLPVYADEGATVVGLEPDLRLLEVAARRDRRVHVVPGSAEHLPFRDASIDVVHARFAYFWPPHCAAGLAEALRVLRPGGALVVVDNDQRHGEFADLLSAAANAAQGRAEVTDSWWAGRGAERIEVMSSWQFTSRGDLEAVLRLEFPGPVADRWLASNPSRSSLTYGYVLFAVRRRSSDDI
jgi:ubiquinone/menaquinone biosynthesis C-methylase UbiE